VDLDAFEIPAPPDTRDEARGREERHARLMAAVTTLKPRAVEILVLHYKHGYSDAQIAALLGTSRGVVAVTLYRIRARLKTLLRPAKAGSEGETR
jgi:RNA polymerase sigma factor (sigma-70 family)